MINPYNQSNPYGLTEKQIFQPLPYEKKIKTQHMEGGIIEVLVDSIKNNEKFFLEIGFGSGDENMSAMLLDNKWNGLGVDLVEEEEIVYKNQKGFTYKRTKVEPDNLKDIIKDVPKTFDFFSLDIDSYDFVISEALLKMGYRPKVACLEFNPRFGPIVEASFPYKKIIKKKLYRKKGIYGSSIAKYIKLWESYGYKYFTYDSSLTNLFFYNPVELENMNEFVTHSLSEFPIIEDINKKIIEEHGMWNLSEIYREYK